jgi:NAD(P)-dependent dehydrogenase (short-subunit alcohol dehydrogenase family)
MEFGKHGITVNTYAPGAIDTVMSAPAVLRYAHPCTHVHGLAHTFDAIGTKRDGKPPGSIMETVRFFS